AATGSRSRACPSRASRRPPARACSLRSTPGFRRCSCASWPSAWWLPGSSTWCGRSCSGSARGARRSPRPPPRSSRRRTWCSPSRTRNAPLTGPREERPADKAAQSGAEFLAASLDPVAPAALAQVLGREHPQVIALVLANLRARKAAEVLAALPEDLQPEIAERIADLQS